MTETHDNHETPPAAEPAILPPAASASGKENAFSLRCSQGFSMLYAGCIARLGALDGKDIKVPADWNECRTQRSMGRCEATRMREEELLQGKAIYFRPRQSAPLTGGKPWAAPRAFGGPATPTAPAGARPGTGLTFAPAPRGTGKSVLSSLATLAGAASRPVTLSDAITKLAANVRADESPLQAIRRMQAEQAAKNNPTATTEA